MKTILTPVICWASLALTLISPVWAQIVVDHESPNPDEIAVTIRSPAPVFFNGYEVDYPSLSAPKGLQLMGTNTGGLNVAETTGNFWEEVNASAFNVTSDLRAKKDLEAIDSSNISQYLDYLRGMETVSFRYLREGNADNLPKHIGVIAQSLPAELTAAVSEYPNGTGQELLAARLADWVGLLTVCLKDAERRISELEAQLAVSKGTSLPSPRPSTDR
jgi:hypothetical protein